MKSTSSLENRLRNGWKWLLSFRKREWEFDDYPILIREQETDSEPLLPRLKMHRYVAQIDRWYISGAGDTCDEALIELKKSYRSALENRAGKGKAQPRPGTQVEIEFAPQERVMADADLAQDFIERVLELEWAWISDESSLWDFHGDENNDVHYKKIKEIYGVDVSDIESAKLSEILERIAAHRKTG